MKKAKLDQASAAVASNQNELYQTVIDLDKSSERPDRLLSSVYELLALSPELIGCGQSPSAVSRSSSGPKCQWALRWCLTKLAAAAADTDQAGEDIRLDLRAWKLVYHLLSVLPSKTAVSLLIDRKFAKTVASTLTLLRSRSSAAASDADHDEHDGTNYATLSRYLSSQESRILGVFSGSKGKKRKRSSPPEAAQGFSPFVVFQSVTDVLRLLQQAVDRDDSLHFAKPTLSEAVFRLEAGDACELLSNALVVSNDMLQSCLGRTEPAMTADVDLVGPYAYIWQTSGGGGQSQDVSKRCLPFLDKALLPCLELLRTLRQYDQPQNSVSALQDQIDELVAQHVILPFRQTFIDKSKFTRDDDTELEQAHRQVADRLTPANVPIDTTKPGLSNSVAAASVARLFDLAFKCCSRSTMTQRASEDPWLSSLFFVLSKCLGFDFEEGSKSIESADFDAIKAEALRSMLQSCAEHGLRIANPVLESAALHVSGLASGDRISNPCGVHWALVMAALKMNPGIITPVQKSAPTPLATTLFRLLSSIGRTEMKQCDPRKMPRRVSYDDIIEEVLLPLVGALTTTRQFTEFLSFWESELRQCMSVEITKSAHDAGGKQLLPWLDERVLDAISLSMSMGLSTTQKLKLVQTYCRRFDRGDIDALLPTLVLCDCALNSWHHEAPSEKFSLQILELVQSHIQNLGVSKESLTPKSEHWRVWRLLSSSLRLLRDNPRIQDVLVDVEKLGVKAGKKVSRVLKGRDSGDGDLQESLACFRFLIALNQLPSGTSTVFKDQLVSATKSLRKAMNAQEEDEGKMEIDKISSSVLQPKAVEVADSASLEFVLVCVLLLSDVNVWSESGLEPSHVLEYLGRASQTAEDSATSTEFDPLWLWKRICRSADLQEDALSVKKISQALTDTEREGPEFVPLEFSLGSLQSPLVSSLKTADRNALRTAVSARLQSNKKATSDDEHDTKLAFAKLQVLGDPSGARFKVSMRSSQAEIPDADRSLEQCCNMTKSLEGAAILNVEDIAAFSRLTVSQERRTDELRSHLCRLMSRLLTVLAEAQDTSLFIKSARLANHILSHQSWAVSQVHIDTLLSLVAVRASRVGGTFESPAATSVFTCLCRILGSILSKHRAKTGGRYHLLVPALKGLLRCLFDANASRGSSSRTIEQPDWVSGGADSLDTDCATQLSRLLTSLCDPTVSAARSTAARKGQDLNDPTKKARSLAGQSLQFVLMEFCDCQLRGRLEPTKRTQLEPGLYSILEALSKDAMQNMNAAMNSSQRAIFRTLYDDWRRFGR